MAEHVSFQPNNAEAYEDRVKMVVDQLAQPDTVAGLARAAEVRSDYYSSLAEQGIQADTIAYGVTSGGMCVEIAELSKVRIEDQVGDVRPDYVVFAFSLSEVAQDGFTDSLAPRRIRGSTLRNGHQGRALMLEVEDPSVMLEAYRFTPPDASGHQEPIREDQPRVDKVVIGLDLDNLSYFDGKRIDPIDSFKEDVLGPERRALVDKEAQSLNNAANKIDSSIPDGMFELLMKRKIAQGLAGQLGVGRDSKATAVYNSVVGDIDAEITRQSKMQDAKSAHLRELAAKIMDVAVANPEDVDGKHVLNPEKAEEIAYAMKLGVDRSQKWYTRTRKHMQAAERAGESAARWYDSRI